MKKLHILFTFLLTFNGVSTAIADTVVGVYAGISYWQHDLADDIESALSNTTRNESGNVFYIALEHPVPFLPNIRVQKNDITGTVKGTFQIIDFDGIRDIRAVNKEDWSHTNFTLYYEVLDSWLNLDLGMSVKHFDGYAGFNITEQTNIRKQLNDLIPVLFLKGQVDLPLSGLSIYGNVETLSLSHNDVTDLEIGINYESNSGLGGVLGYRNLDFNIEKNNNLAAKINADGFFVGINYHF